MARLRTAFATCSVIALVLALAPAASAAGGVGDPAKQWLPRTEGAKWTYEWSDSEFQPAPRTEVVELVPQTRTAFRLRWEERRSGAYDVPARGSVDFRQEDGGPVNVTYQSTPPPPQFPVLCPQAAGCANSLAGTMYMLIWGSRSRVLSEPLVSGARWTSTGGARNDVVARNRYEGTERVTVPAFPEGVAAAKVVSEITQFGAIGDPYGTGVRTVWWVRGVGPVKILFDHVGGQVGYSELKETNLEPLPPPPDSNLFPLEADEKMRFRWRNNRHMRRWSTQRFTVGDVVNNTARIRVRHVKGPIQVKGSYLLASRLSGVTQQGGSLRVATRVQFPATGPRGVPEERRRRFFTPFDFMTFGFGPALPSYAEKGDTWRSSRKSRDFQVYGVTGRSRVAGRKRVRTPAGRFRAVVVKSTLRQRGSRFGSGRRTMWFAPGKGLVKIVFRHRDGSVSTVQRTR